MSGRGQIAMEGGTRPRPFLNNSDAALHDTSKERGKGPAPSFVMALESDVEEMKSLVTCRICVGLIYEPYTIKCGHTFCYSCLAQWFSNHRAKKTCPDCRCDVLLEPAPSYMVSLLQLFIKSKLAEQSTIDTRDSNDLCQAN